MSSSSPQSTTTSLVAITLCAVLQVLAQVVFQVVIATDFGANAEVDTFSAALAIPTVLVAILTSSIGYIMVPLLVPLAQATQQDSTPTQRESSEHEFRQVAFAVGLWAIGTCLVASLIVGLFAFPITALLYRRFGPEERELAGIMLQILSPIIALSAVQGWLQGIYHSRQNFLMPALASAVGPSAVTLLLFLPTPLEQPIYWIPWCLLIGTLATIGCLLPAVRFGIPNQWAIPPATLLAIRRSIPLIAFNSYTKLDPVLDRVLLAGLTVGAISHLNYAQRFITALVLVASSGVSTMAFSDLAGAFSGELSQFRARFFENLRRMILVVVPVVIGLLLFAQPSIKTLLERGQFASHDTTQVSVLLIALIGFFIASAVGDLVSKCFYAVGDTHTPSVIGAIAFTMGIGLKLLGVSYWGVLGLAIATSTYTLFSVLIMLLLLIRRLKLENIGRELGPTTFRSMLASALGSLIAAAVLWLPTVAAWWLAVAFGAITYTICMLMMKDSTWRSMVLRQR
jgi:putative peptidoglycan lipid II flippase